MKGSLLSILVLLAAGCAGTAELGVWPPGDPAQNQWIDADTGHKVIRLSRREGVNEVFYFHQNPFTAEGDKMVFIGYGDTGRNAFTVDLKTLEIKQITKVNTGFEVLSPKSRTLYYMSGDAVLSTQIDTLETREIAKVPHHYTYGRGFTVNSDETQLAACYCRGEEEYYTSGKPRRQWIREIWEAKLPNAMYTVDIATGKINEFYHENEWLGHVQFSPTDPALIEFSHEGPGHELDRTWMVRSDGSGLKKLYEKKNPREFQTHEFWSPDGRKVWCDFQRPNWVARTFPFLRELTFPTFHLQSINVQTGETAVFPLKRRYASRHFNISADQSMFCGDGEGGRLHLSPSQEWIFLLRPDHGKLSVERLCSMKSHNYKDGPEPNTHFTPDGKWVVFQSDMGGTRQVYAVSVDKEQ